MLLIEQAGGIDRALSTALALWRKPLAVRDSGKIARPIKAEVA